MLQSYLSPFFETATSAALFSNYSSSFPTILMWSGLCTATAIPILWGQSIILTIQAAGLTTGLISLTLPCIRIREYLRQKTMKRFPWDYIGKDQIRLGQLLEMIGIMSDRTLTRMVKLREKAMYISLYRRIII